MKFLSGFSIGDWCWFTRQASPSRVIERQVVWGEVAYCVWLPAKDSVVRARAVDPASSGKRAPERGTDPAQHGGGPVAGCAGGHPAACATMCAHDLRDAWGALGA